MELGNLFKPKEEPAPPELFIAIQIQEGLLKSAVWQISNGKAEILKLGSIQDWTDTESLVLAADASLTVALEEATPEPDRVVFGLPESWIKEDKISPDATGHLKGIIEKLELKPIGFVVITEALIQHLKDIEGIPPTVILLELHSTKVNVVVVKLGEIIGREEVGRSEDLGKDVEEGLTRLNLDQLPARILLINGQDTEIEQQLTSYQWQERLPFLHLPKVETPTPEFSITAIAISGGSEAAKSLGIEIAPPPKVKQESPPEPTEEVQEELEEQEKSPPEESADSNDRESESLGFVTNEDVRNSNEPLSSPPSPKTTKTLPLSNIKDSINSFFKRFSSPKVSTSTFSLKKPIIIAIPIILLLISLISVLAYSNLSTASITLFVETKDLNTEIEIAISDSPHESLPTLPASSDSLDLEVTGSIPTSGEVLVGEKATGEVTLFNKTESEKILEAGTVLTTSDNLKFTLDDDVTIASRSAEEQAEGINIVYGKTTSTITASSIGAEHNIDVNTELSVGTYPKSSIEAKVSSNLSGGTSRTVKAASKEDRQKLLDDLTEQLTQQAKEQLSSSSDTTIVSKGVDVESQEFSHDAGEESDTLALTLKGTANFYEFNPETLQTLLSDQLQNDIPVGFKLDPETTKIEITPPDSEEDAITTTADIKAKLIPDISLDDYKTELKGKNINAAHRLLQNVAGYQKVTIVISPKIPFLSTRLPSKTDHIQLDITPINP